MRIITTVEELEALPDKSVIQDGDGDVMQKHDGEWYYTSDAAAPATSASVDLPKNLMWAP